MVSVYTFITIQHLDQSTKQKEYMTLSSKGRSNSIYRKEVHRITTRTYGSKRDREGLLLTRTNCKNHISFR